MVPTTDLDARLRRHHEELVGLFTAHRVSTPLPRRRHTRVLVVGLILAVAAAIAAPVLALRLAPSHVTERQVEIAGFTVTVAASTMLTPRMSREQATSAAEAFVTSHPPHLPYGGPIISGLSVDGASFVAAVRHVVGPCVNVSLQRATNVWVVAVAAPAQSGWSQVRGAFLVDDATGNLVGGDLLMSPARDEPVVCR
ncbi:MAG TPA: hypothetical protein VF155_04345 [Candidatus Dormibacteraeota bacterium]